MFEISKENDPHFNCLVCGLNKSMPASSNIYLIGIMNKYKQGVELHLCSNCCNVLSKLIEEPDKRMHGIKMMSIDELEELTNNTKCSII